LENTVHGQAIPLEHMRAASDAARAGGLSVHLDGARFFNAITALKCEPFDLASIADTVSVCLSKGIGAPIGSVLSGPRDLIAKARRNRKLLGGGIRQVGVLGAAAMFALEQNLPKLQEDHDRATRLADELRDLDCGLVTNDTNMVFFTPDLEDHAPLHAHLGRHHVVIGGQFPTIRMVTHYDINDSALDAVITGFRSYFDKY
jgi:threonine aldolase